MTDDSMYLNETEDCWEFPVVCTIGTVKIDPRGSNGIPPSVAAMELIARHDTPGTYRFPMQDGRTVVVTVDYV